MRVKRGFKARRRRNRILKLAKGYRGRRKNCYKRANQAVERALDYASRDRARRKRDFRSLWIVRINAAARAFGLSYSRLIAGLTTAKVRLDPKILADLAVTDPEGLKALASIVEGACCKIASRLFSSGRAPKSPRPPIARGWKSFASATWERRASSPRS